MEITCPECSSKFNLPDKLAKPGAKLRCAVCKHVFQLPGGARPVQAPAPSPPPPTPPVPPQYMPPPIPAMPRKGKSRLLLWLLLGLFTAAAAGAGTWFWMQRDASPPPEENVSKNVEMLTMRNVRQYNVLNEKSGKVFVIEGRVVNEFDEPKELIELEGALYDKDKKPLAMKRQLAGTQLSLFQLQVLNEKEMDSFLNNKVELLANNTNIPPGGEVPFMILFYEPPENVAEFGVKIVNARDAKK